MHGICTSPPMGSQVSPRLCSIAISAAFSTCSGVPPRISASPAAAIDAAEPTSPWQPTSAPEIDARSLYSDPMRPRSAEIGSRCRRGRPCRRGVVHRVVQNRGDDPRGTIRRSGDDPSAGRVLLVDGQRDQVDPILGKAGSRSGSSRSSFRYQSRARRRTCSGPGGIPHGRCLAARIPP